MEREERIKISKTIQKELEKNPKWKVLIHLQDKGKLSAYQIAKDLDWEPSKAHAVIKQLEKSRSVRTKLEISNGRAVKLVQLARS